MILPKIFNITRLQQHQIPSQLSRLETSRNITEFQHQYSNINRTHEEPLPRIALHIWSLRRSKELLHFSLILSLIFRLLFVVEISAIKKLVCHKKIFKLHKGKDYGNLTIMYLKSKSLFNLNLIVRSALKLLNAKLIHLNRVIYDSGMQMVGWQIHEDMNAETMVWKLDSL